jgi:hypothetical protein
VLLLAKGSGVTAFPLPYMVQSLMYNQNIFGGRLSNMAQKNNRAEDGFTIMRINLISALAGSALVNRDCNVNYPNCSFYRP